MKNLYVVYDTLAQESGPIFEAKNDEVAKRAYDQLVEKMSPAERQTFVLNYVGQFNDETMEFCDNYTREVLKNE